MKALPAMVLDCGSTRPSTACMAMAASTAEPPALSTSQPALVAKGVLATAMYLLECLAVSPRR